MNTVILDFIKWYEKDPVEKIYEWKTDVVEYDNKNSQRNAAWSTPRRHYFLNLAFMKKRGRDRVIEFFQRTKGGFSSFLYRDEDDYSTINLFVGNGTTTIFQLYKAYYPGTTETWSESKKDIKSGVVVKLNGIIQTSGWTLVYTTGILTFGIAPGNGVAVEITYEFYFRVRFVSDALKSTKLFPSNPRYEFDVLEMIET